MGVILVCEFTGRRSSLSRVLREFEAARLPVSTPADNPNIDDPVAHRDREWRPEPRYHALADPEPMMVPVPGDTTEPEPLVDDETGTPVMRAAEALVDKHGDPVWDDPEAVVEVLTDNLDRAVQAAARAGFGLRSHGPSGFDSVEEFEAVAAGLHRPPTLRDQLLTLLDSDPGLADAVRQLVGGSR